MRRNARLALDEFMARGHGVSTSHKDLGTADRLALPNSKRWQQPRRCPPDRYTRKPVAEGLAGLGRSVPNSERWQQASATPTYRRAQQPTVPTGRQGLERSAPNSKR